MKVAIVFIVASVLLYLATIEADKNRHQDN